MMVFAPSAFAAVSTPNFRTRSVDGGAIFGVARSRPREDAPRLKVPRLRLVEPRETVPFLARFMNGPHRCDKDTYCALIVGRIYRNANQASNF